MLTRFLRPRQRAMSSSLYKSAPTNATVSYEFDFRSDTVTRPTKEMREAMMFAEVGDDVYQEDVTVNRLEERVARMAGHEAAVFCPSGTMTNQLGIRTHLKTPPYSVICDRRAHIYIYEASGISFHSGAQVVTIDPTTESKTHLTAGMVSREMVVDDDVHHAPSGLICLENTMNGEIFPFDEMRKISKLARENSIPLHLDGARLWNACVATHRPVSDYGSLFDSMSLCFSKGLGAPVGSVLTGSTKFIKKARHYRKLFGGGWRQSGILAQSCLYALDNHLPRLHEDHVRAKVLETGLRSLGFELTRRVDTSMVWVDLTAVEGLTADRVCEELDKVGVRNFGGGETVMRFVVHQEISDEGVERVVQVFKRLKETGINFKV